VQARLVDLETDARYPLSRLDPPETGDERALAGQPLPFNDAAREALRNTGGAFWFVESSEDGLQYRFAVLLAERLRGVRARLDLFTHVADDGTPLGAATLELARGFFYMAILGDSVQWGNGLTEPSKMSSLTIAAIERATGQRVVWQRYAQSGARIVTAEGDATCAAHCWGEVPTVSTSITMQADQIERPDVLDLVLMDGCINDVGVGRILNPATPAADMLALTDQFCDQALGDLLLKVHGLAPQAHIIVTGYFQMVSEESDLLNVTTWLTALGFPPDGETEALTQLTQRSVDFRDAAHAGMQAAVDRLNAEAGATRALFADAGFGPQNAIFASDPWLWNLIPDSTLLDDLNLGFELALFPEDAVQERRLQNCMEWDTAGPVLACIYASVGHPNVTGAQAYADAIIARLREVGVLPAP
jgi:hypothetical protein